MNPIKLLLSGMMMFFVNMAFSQDRSQVQHIKFDEIEWEQMADKVQRKYVYGEKGMMALFKMQKGAKVPPHQHPNEQTSYITKGSVLVKMQGKEYHVKAGEILIIPANITHEFECLEDDTYDIDFFAPPRMDWINGTANYFTAQTSSNLEAVAKLDVRPGNVAVSKEGRVFSTIHPLGSNNYQLVEIKNGKAIPYPNLSLQKQNGQASDKKFDTMLGLTFDKQNRLWVTDMGLNLGKSRVWVFDINKNKVVETIEIPENILPKGSFAQDIAVDEKNGWIYLADISNPGIIAVNTKTKKARRFSNHSSLQAENIDMVIDGKVINFGGKPARVAIDPITLSADRETLFFGAMNGKTWYSVPSKLFRDDKKDEEIAAAIQKVADKPISDGAFTDDAGNHYFTNLQEHSITKISPDKKMTTLVQDAEKLQWPDNVYLGNDGWIYISANQLNSTPAFTGGTDEGKVPFYIYRFKIK